MKSIVKHFKLQPDGSRVRLPDEIHEYSAAECCCQPDETHVLQERWENGRHTIVLSAPPKGRGRPVDPLRKEDA